MRGKHFSRSLPKSFGSSFADLKNLVELKLLIVDQMNVAETALLVQINSRIDIRESGQIWQDPYTLLVLVIVGDRKTVVEGMVAPLTERLRRVFLNSRCQVPNDGGNISSRRIRASKFDQRRKLGSQSFAGRR